MDIHGIYSNPNYVTKRRSKAKLTLIIGGLPDSTVRLTHTLNVRLTPPFEDISHIDVVDAKDVFRTILEGVYYDLPNHLRHMSPLSGGIANVEVASCPQTASPKACQYVLTATLGEQTILVDSVTRLVEAWKNANAVLSMVENALQHSGWDVENRSYLLSASKTPRQWLVRACVDQNITLVFEVPSTKTEMLPRPATDLAT